MSALITQLLRRSKLRTRLMSAFLLISMLPALVLMFFSVHVYTDSIISKVSQSAQQSTQLLNHNLSLVLEEYSRYINLCSVSDELMKRLSDEYDGAKDASLQNALEPSVALNLNVSAVMYLRDTLILDRNRNVVYTLGHVGISLERLSELLSATDNASPSDYVGYYHAPYGVDCIALCRKIYDISYPLTHIGYIVSFIDASIFNDKTFPLSSLGEGSGMLLINADGDIVSSQNTEVAKNSSAVQSYLDMIDWENKPGDGDTAEYSAENDLIIYTYNEQYNLYLVSLIPKNNITMEIQRVRLLVIAVTVALVLLCFLMSTIVYRSISAPIGRIVSVCSSSRPDDRGSAIGDTAPDEIGYLARTIDSMSQNNQRMLEELRLKDEQKRELELDMLQCQINPHFLFNTLNTLKWIAAINGVSMLSDGISSLAGILRSTLIQKDEFIALRDELGNLKDYCFIQNLRYADQFHVSYLVDDQTLDCRIPRFLLQPLVENSILHGIYNSDTVLNISVCSSVLQDMLHISIQDDGVGFSLDSVLDKDTNRFTGIGLSNVDDRLRMYYGEQSRLQIQTKPSGGTVCRMAIPLSKCTPASEES